MAKPAWTDKVINTAQIGGIETSVLDNGLGKDTRIAWVNTGTPLRYKIVLDRAMDISEAFYNEHSLAFLTHGCTIGTRPDVNHGLDWLTAFNGGLLTTCGLRHIGGPESDTSGDRGLHGNISNIPAELECVVNPDIYLNKTDFCISGMMKETSMFMPNLELRRKISGVLGEAAIRIEDIVVNRANTDVGHMLLYHFNFGYPLIDEGTEIIWKGKWSHMGRESDEQIFNNKTDFKKCSKPIKSHSGYGEAVGVIDIAPDRAGLCTAGLYNPKLGLAVSMTFKKEQLPYLTNWQHFGSGDYVVGLEPGTCPPIGQNRAKTEGKLIILKPGQSRSYQVEIKVLTAKSDIEKLRKLNG